MDSIDLTKLIPLTPIELKNMLGHLLTLYEIRKNKLEKKLIPFKHTIELLEVRSIYGSENKVISFRYINDGFECKSIILAPDGSFVKNPEDIGNTKYIIVR